MMGLLPLPWRLYIYGGVAAVMITFVTFIYFKGRADGYASYAASVAQQLKEKSDAVNQADDLARRCAADPECRVRDDGYRRD